MQEFKPGDVVTLKSGGPKMTVEATGNYGGGLGVGPKDGVKCTWFDEKKALQTGVFDAATLEK